MAATGIGPALHKARVQRGKSIEEASRETRIRAEYLRALEHEDFDNLLGEVYARGFLRSYSTYLGLDADRVLTVYNRHFGAPVPTLPAPAPGPARNPLTPHPHWAEAVRNHPSWAFLIGVALLAVVAFAASGLFRADAPATATGGSPASDASLAQALAPGVVVAVRAVDPVVATVTIDGVTHTYRFKSDEARSFEGSERIDLELDRGGAATITVNGHQIGTPGEPGAAYVDSFGPLDFRETPSSSAT